ncbi:Glucose-methanol-choline oxidoreductase [Metarhizium album ARSEF 1941]|uniref:Glucose-methanol-choline oxidoreductase n=1 Tax=Metarhizium album (strain ARSEF 1941) TaxID=1081103 RepID=A0A0B2WLT1_METAS|nr:Glucose-methanol-choline oxidoreductase [Metarhizium album ARSEF 1941]KHN94893.1 Glucose-methanol-choline oxidoreductase [Metarhizium album ARSEF 1941]
MGRRHANPLHHPLHYAALQPRSGPPVTAAAAGRALPGYDYVIVGAGAAGCVLASKLSEDEHVSVLVLEAGGDNTKVLESKVPLMFSKLFHSEHDWDYYTVEQPAVASRRLYWPRGRIIGGSSSMNAMIYHHCSPSDFDEWVSVHGCTGWGHSDLAPHFRCVERFTPNSARPAIDAANRGRTGQWHTGYSWLSHIVDDGFIPACDDAGIPPNSDINTADGSLGVTRLMTFIDTKGQRSSLATAFLTPEVLRRPNLYVACGAHVTRVLFDRINNPKPAAIGVEFQVSEGGERYQVHARREVILSAGAVNTPQTLMLSGIGPAEELQKHSISRLVANDNVGRQLKDHLCSNGVLCKAKKGSTLDYLNNDIKAIPALVQWLLFGTGPLTSNVGEAAAFVRSFEYEFPASAGATPPKDYTSGDKAPDVEIIGAPIAFIHHGEERPLDDANVFSLAPIGLRPRSSGTISLKSANAFDHPIIDPRYLTDEEDNDIKVLIVGIRLCLKIMRSPSFQKYLEPVPTNDDTTSYWWPYSCSDVDAITDEQLGRFLVERAFTLYHPVGSARMGPAPSSSVVDVECRVHGTSRLRVVDASIFPEQISGHPTAPIAAIAHRASELIQKCYAAA